MRANFIVAFAAAALAASSAQAFDLSSANTSFRGFRIEGNIGGDRWQALGDHNTKLGFGGTVGFDGVIYDKIVVGAEGSYWQAKGFTENSAGGLNGGSVADKSFQEYDGAFRAGYLVTPNILVFGKGGIAVNEQRKRFDPSGSLFYSNGQIVGPEQGYYRHENYYGYQVGGGVEYTLPQLGSFNLPLYVNAQYVYSNFDTHTSRQRVMAGIGIRFK